MAVCEPCRGIIPWFLTDAHRRYTLFQELCEMIKSAEQCPSCAIIVDAIRLNQNDDVYPKQSLTFEELKYQAASYHPGNRQVILDVLGDNDLPGSLNNPKSYIYGLSITITSEMDASPMGYLGIYAEDVLAGSSVVTGKFPSQDTGSIEALSLVRKWMHVCTETHQHCRVTLAGDVLDERSEPPKLPTRVIDLDQGQQHLCPRLVESHGACAQYAALSHCWGPPVKRPLMTTAGNVHDHLKGIPFDRLPKTFQDAVIVARSLGLRYVWIDSLCILQGDSEDWLRESAGMGLIYQNATITIAASGAADGTVGCFFKRTSPPKTVRLPESTLIKDSIGIVHLALPDSRHNGTFDRYYSDRYGNLPDLSPLQRRAWITQEWQLARRIVHYRQGMMVWCCNTTAEREDGRNFNGLVHEKTLSKYPRFQSSNLQQSNDEVDIGADFTCLTFWTSLVSSYTARSLTYQEDRLVALEGLVTELKRRWPDQQYSFGLWHEWLHIQVLWRGPEVVSICLERPESLQRIGIPTWSWASTVGPVHFTRFGPPLRDFGMLEPIWSHVSVIDKTLLVTAKVKRVGRIQPPSQENDLQLRQLGQPAWRLGFTGNTEYAAETPKTGTLLGPEQTEYLVLDPENEERPLGLASLDEGVIPEEEVFCVPVAKRGPTVGDDAFSHQRLALFLVVDQGNRANLTYLRVGMGTIMKQGWFDDVQQEQIRIN